MLKIADYFLLSFFILSAVCFYALFSPGGLGVNCEIWLNGELYGVYELAENRELHIVSKDGENTVVIQNGSVFVKDADCPDKLCTLQSPAEKSGEVMVCLPNRLIIRVTGGENEYDAVSK